MRSLSTLAMVLVSLLLMAGTGSAQSKPDFSGTWTLVPDPKAPPPPPPGSGLTRIAITGPAIRITQDATTLRVDRQQGGAAVAFTYTLGGQGKNSTTGRGGPADVFYETAWAGNTFVITSQLGTSTTLTSKQALSFAADGTLVVESTSPPVGGGDPVTTKTLYKKG